MNQGDWRDVPDDRRGKLYVHAVVESDDDVRSFYEIPDSVVNLFWDVETRGNGHEVTFVDALVTALTSGVPR